MWDFGYYDLFPTCGNEGNQCEITDYYYVSGCEAISVRNKDNFFFDVFSSW